MNFYALFLRNGNKVHGDYCVNENTCDGSECGFAAAIFFVMHSLRARIYFTAEVTG